MGKFVPHFEVLRGLAALWVFISHILMIVDWQIPVLSRGALAVDVFILLSGFVITLMRINEPETYTVYIFRRFMRLYPLFIIAVILGIATSHLYAVVLGASPWADAPSPEFLNRAENEARDFWTHLALHLTMLHGVVPDTVLPQAPLMFSGPLWSISLEWQFYLVAPLLVPLFVLTSPRASLMAIMVFLAIVALAFICQQYWIGEVASFLPLKLPLFCAGIFCGVAWSQARLMDPMRLLTLVCLAMVICMALTGSRLPVLIWFAAYYCAAAGDKTWPTRLIGAIVAWPVSRFVGRISYSLYVLHMPILLTVAAFVVIPLAAGQPKIIAASLLLVVALPVAITLSALTYYGIDKPLIAWARQVGKRLSVPTAVA